jgi:F-type H+-transporting ATPase subunit a
MAFNWTQLALNEIVPHFDAHSKSGQAMTAAATLGIAATLSVGLGLIARQQLGTGQAAVVPTSKFSVRGIFELLTEYIGGLSNSVIGKHGPTYAPMFTAVFFFVLLNNLLGVIPGMTPATENLNTTLAFGVFIFLTYNFLGIKEQGAANYFKHFLGPYLALAVIMFPIEIVSHLVRPVSLSLRLANVLTGDHLVLGIFLNMAPAFVPIPFYMMGIFVCLVQAFVFTLLSMVYVALATAVADHH